MTLKPPLRFECANCHVDFPEPFCDFCGRMLMPIKDSTVASSHTREVTLLAARRTP